MAVTVPTGFGQASLIFNVTGRPQNVVTTIGFEVGGGTPAEQAELIRAAWGGTGKLFKGDTMKVGWTFVGVAVSIAGIGPDPVLAQSFIPEVGSQAGEALPSNCAFLVRKTTARGGRKGRGRMYLPPTRVGEESVSITGVHLASTITATNSGLAASLAAMDTAGVPAMLLHEDGSAPDAITSLTLQSVIATQRRRMR